MTLQEQINTAREDMIFREEQLHAAERRFSTSLRREDHLAAVYEAARDRYLRLLAEMRLAQLAQMPR